MKTTPCYHATRRLGAVSLLFLTIGGTTARAEPGGLFRRIGKAISHVANKVEQAVTGDDNHRDPVAVSPSPRPLGSQGTPGLRTGPAGQTRYLEPTDAAGNPTDTRVYGVSSRSYVQLEPGGPLSPPRPGASPQRTPSSTGSNPAENAPQVPPRPYPSGTQRIAHDPFAVVPTPTVTPQEPTPGPNKVQGKTTKTPRSSARTSNTTSEPSTPQAVTDPATHAEVPFARLLRPGRVSMPFPPYSELDVQGMDSGSLAKDPTSGKMFRVP